MLPTLEHTLLLRAALLKGEPALASFAAWRKLVDIDNDLDGGSFRLLPLAYANLQHLGCKDPEMRRLKGVYRHSWCEAQGRHHAAGTLLGELRSLGIPVMLLKGAALAAAYYEGAALRPMADLDILVPRDRLNETISALTASDWTMLDWGIHPPVTDAKLRYALRRNHALTFRGTGDRLLDLHWLFFQECISRSANQTVWSSAIPVRFADIEVLRPAPEDLLFQVCVHGMLPNPFPSIRWIPDAVMILRHEKERLNWDRLIERSRQSWLSEPLRVALDCLARDFEIEIPPRVDGQLRSGPRAWLERFDANTVGGRLRLTEIARWSLSDRAVEFPFLVMQFARNRLWNRATAL